MLKQLRKRTEGFTIIEVLIVLAIAGLILLIVFLAVPALQRNSRNTQRKNDIAAILGGISEYTNNHGGQLPPDEGALGLGTDIKLGHYTDAEIDYEIQADPTDVTNDTTETNVIIRTNAKCDTTPGSGNAVATGASSRSYVALFTTENSADGVKTCQES